MISRRGFLGTVAALICGTQFRMVGTISSPSERQQLWQLIEKGIVRDDTYGGYLLPNKFADELLNEIRHNCVIDGRAVTVTMDHSVTVEDICRMRGITVKSKYWRA